MADDLQTDRVDMVTNLKRPTNKFKCTKGQDSNLKDKEPEKLKIKVEIECKQHFD